jgi:cold shock CspA family protein
VRLPGILRSWNDERGFGFIAPTHGGAELFVHISALPRDGSRPVAGESVTYELGRGENGKPQAMKVIREAVGIAASRPKAPTRRTSQGNPVGATLVALLVLAAIAYAYSRVTRQPLASPMAVTAPMTAVPRAVQGAFRCDGRTYCSQMTSCAEATYFLKNCPGAKMDGNNDGVPCEQQWCK